MARRIAMALLCAAALFWSVSSAAQEPAKIRAFPGAEGFGAYAKGGRGGKVALVTTLEDYIPGKEKPVSGSLRWAVCEVKGPRVVVFRVSGMITLRAPLAVKEPYLTLAGQTAPGDGIGVKGDQSGGSAYCVIMTHDVIVRHMRFRPGDGGAAEYKKTSPKAAFDEHDALSLVRVRDVIVDHCSLSWAMDETMDVIGKDVTNVTVQWCILSESLHKSHHYKGPHGMGVIVRVGGNVTFHHNLLAKHNTRSPRPGTYGEGSALLDFRNNVIYLSHGYTARDAIQLNYVGNYIKRPNRSHPFEVFPSQVVSIYAEGNYLEGGLEQNRDNWRLFKAVRGPIEHNKAKAAFPIPSEAAVVTDSAQDAYAKVLDRGGATLPKRDGVDRRIAMEVKTGQGEIINSPEEVGGWPELKPAPAPKDSDSDGMPDEWETRYGLNPSDPSDANADKNGNGYTNIEEYLNGADASAK